jgi:hypothetical protein
MFGHELLSLNFFPLFECCGRRWPRPPNAEDIARLLQKVEDRGFSDMIGSIDCMH